jgi:hypothetical protein
MFGNFDSCGAVATEFDFLTEASAAATTPAALHSTVFVDSSSGFPCGKDSSGVAHCAGGGSVSSVSGTSPIASSGGATPAISLNSAGVTSTYLATANKTRTCAVTFGDDSAIPLLTGQIEPQKSICYADVAQTVYQILVLADSGASTVQLAYRHSSGGAPTTTNYTAAVLTPATVSNITDKVVCANTGGTAITVGGVSVTCSTLATGTWTQGDTIETVAGTADGTTKRMSIFVSTTVN